MLHPTAIIHPDARLGSGVSVGPYAVIEGPAEIGDGCTIQAHAIIGAHVVMGKTTSSATARSSAAIRRTSHFSPR